MAGRVLGLDVRERHIGSFRALNGHSRDLKFCSKCDRKLRQIPMGGGICELIYAAM